MDVKELSGLWSGFQASRIVLTANNYNIFNYLEEKAFTVEELAPKLKADKRALEILLDALCGLGLLTKSKGKFRNTPVSSKHLVSGKPEYQGDIMRHAETLWQNWSALDEVLITGLPARRAHDHQAFINGMHNIAQSRVKSLLSVLDLKGVKTALDLGGGPGTYAIALAKKGIDVTLYDLPETMRIARTNARNAGVKIKLRKGDFVHDDIGRGYDLILLSQILHAYSPRENADLLLKCFQALNPGGVIYIQEIPIDKELTSPVRSAIFSVNMLVNTLGGRCYNAVEIEEWLKSAGFLDISTRNIQDTMLVEGRVPEDRPVRTRRGRKKQQ